MDIVGNVPRKEMNRAGIEDEIDFLLWRGRRSDKLVVKFQLFLIYISLWECHRVAQWSGWSLVN